MNDDEAATPQASGTVAPDVVLAAFRDVTGWTDAEVLHYVACTSYCNPICGAEEDMCPEGRRVRDATL